MGGHARVVESNARILEHADFFHALRVGRFKEAVRDQAACLRGPYACIVFVELYDAIKFPRFARRRPHHPGHLAAVGAAAPRGMPDPRVKGDHVSFTIS